jgi:hypothetical protein
MHITFRLIGHGFILILSSIPAVPDLFPLGSSVIRFSGNPRNHLPYIKDAYSASNDNLASHPAIEYIARFPARGKRMVFGRAQITVSTAIMQALVT